METNMNIQTDYSIEEYSNLYKDKSIEPSLKGMNSNYNYQHDNHNMNSICNPNQ